MSDYSSMKSFRSAQWSHDHASPPEYPDLTYTDENWDKARAELRDDPQFLVETLNDSDDWKKFVVELFDSSSDFRVAVYVAGSERVWERVQELALKDWEEGDR